MSTNRPVQFELYATQPQVLLDFYQQLFGWRYMQAPNMEYWITMTEKEGDDPKTTMGINGGIMKRPDALPKPSADAPVNGHAVAMMVESIEDSTAKATSLGGKVVVPTVEVGGGLGLITYLVDPEGHLFSLFQNNPAHPDFEKNNAGAVYNRPVHFEVTYSERDRCFAFYREVFGWKIEPMPMPPGPDEPEYWFVLCKHSEDDNDGLEGGMMQRPYPGDPEPMAVNTTVCVTEVADLAATVAKVRAAGGHVFMERMPMPNYGYLAYAHDTEGNTFGMVQYDAAAA